MPRLAGSYDLTSDPRVDMQIAQSIGGAIESGLRNHRIRQEEARKEHLNATLVQTLGRTIKDGITDPGKILEAIESVPDYAESEWYQQMVMAEAQRRMGTTSKYGVMPGTYQHLTPEEQRKASLISAGIEPRVGAAVNEPKAVLSLLDQLTETEADLAFLENAIAAGRFPSDDDYPEGLPTTAVDEKEAAALRRRREILRKQLLSTDLGRQQIEALDRETQAIDRATQAVERGKQVIEIGEQFPIKPFIDKIPETVKVGKLDKVKSVQAIQDAMVEYANVLVQQYGLTDFEAQREAERQVRLLQEKEPPRSRSPFKGWRTLPEGEIYFPQDRAGSPPAVGQPVGEAGAMTDMIARDRSQVDARQIAGDYFSLMTDILGETGQQPAQAQAQPPAQQQKPRPITQEELASGKYLPAVSPDGQEVYVDTAWYEQALGQGYSPITVKSKEEYDNLPSGTIFIAPDGQWRKKPFSEAGAMTDMIARDRSQVDARQIASDYFSLMTDILGETGQRPAQAPAQAPAPIVVMTEDELNKLPSGTIFIAPDGSLKRKP